MKNDEKKLASVLRLDRDELDVKRESRARVIYEDRRTDFYFRSDKDGSVSIKCRPHLHYQIEFFYLHSGRVGACVDSVEYTAGAGDLLIAFPNQLHTFRRLSEEAERYSLFIVSPDFVPELAGIFNSTLPRSPVVSGAGELPRLRGLISGLAEVSVGNSKYRNEILHGYLLAIFGELLPRLELDDIKLGESHTVREVVSFCSKNYDRALSLETLERELHLNKYYISHLFSSKLGIRFNDYINSLRVSQACRLLRYTELTANEISEAVGFNTQRTFNRAFARFRGCTPGEFRRMNPGRTEVASIPPTGVAPVIEVKA